MQKLHVVTVLIFSLLALWAHGEREHINPMQSQCNIQVTPTYLSQVFLGTH